MTSVKYWEIVISKAVNAKRVLDREIGHYQVNVFSVMYMSTQ